MNATRVTPATYNVYRERVLAKTSGQNIHAVNGKLGIINDGCRNAVSPHLSAEVRARQAGHVENAITEIAKLTGVHP